MLNVHIRVNSTFTVCTLLLLKNTRGPLACREIMPYTIHKLKFLTRSTQQLGRKRSLGLQVTYTSP
jgi:hypothetical protein